MIGPASITRWILVLVTAAAGLTPPVVEHSITHNATRLPPSLDKAKNLTTTPWPPTPYRIPIAESTSRGVLNFDHIGQYTAFEQGIEISGFILLLTTVISNPRRPWQNFVAVIESDPRFELASVFFTMDLRPSGSPTPKVLIDTGAQMLATIRLELNQHGSVECMVELENVPGLTGRFQLLNEQTKLLPQQDPTFLYIPARAPELSMLELERRGTIMDTIAIGYALTQVQIQISQMSDDRFAKLEVRIGSIHFVMRRMRGLDEAVGAEFTKEFALEVVKAIQKFEVSYKGGTFFTIWMKIRSKSYAIGFGELSQAIDGTSSVVGNLTVEGTTENRGNELEIFS